MCDDGVRSFVPNVLCWGVTTHDWFTLLDVLDIWRNILRPMSSFTYARKSVTRTVHYFWQYRTHIKYIHGRE